MRVKVAMKVLRIAALSWIALVVAAPGLSGMVLCIDADGHIVLKTAHQGHCRGQAESGSNGQHVASVIAFGASVADCGDCVDVPLSSDNVLQLVREVRHDRPLKGTTFRCVAYGWVAANSGGLQTARVTSHRGHQLGLSSSLLAQRTIVLRI